MTYLYNCTIYTSEETLTHKAILLRGDEIENIIPVSEIPANAEKIDLHGLNIAPGFIDLQVNGGGGVMFNNDPSAEGVEKIFNAHLKYGTTNILPTFITGSTVGMQMAAKAVQYLVDDNHPGILVFISRDH